MKGTTAYDGACECGGLIEADPEPEICIRRAPGTCCPEPSCDYFGRENIEVCSMCGKECTDCVIKYK
jgi:hypothetical protein